MLTEHVRRPFIVSRFGHDDFDRADEGRRRLWMRDVMSAPSFTMADAADWLDIDSLTRWFISFVFCGTSDPYQAVMFRDQGRVPPRRLNASGAEHLRLTAPS